MGNGDILRAFAEKVEKELARRGTAKARGKAREKEKEKERGRVRERGRDVGSEKLVPSEDEGRNGSLLMKRWIRGQFRQRTMMT